jgi:hypothetical protein
MISKGTKVVKGNTTPNHFYYKIMLQCEKNDINNQIFFLAKLVS